MKKPPFNKLVTMKRNTLEDLTSTKPKSHRNYYL